MNRDITGKIVPDFHVETVRLETGDGERELEILLRPYRPGDENGMIECIRSEYGEHYFKQDFYDPKLLRRKAMGDHYIFFVAQCGSEIVGMLAFTFFMPEETRIEVASEIFKQSVRGAGMAEIFLRYAFPLAESLKPSCIFIHAVTFHTIIQKIGPRLGMTPVGFRLGSFLTEQMQNSYHSGKCPKYSEGILILPVEKRSAGTIWLPEALMEFGDKIYHRLGVEYELLPANEGDKLCVPKAKEAVLEFTMDSLQRSCQIRIRRRGRDFGKQIREWIRERREPYWTIQIALDASREMSGYEYPVLKELGFFCAGMKPLCSEREQFYMQWCGDMTLGLENYCLTEEFALLAQDIQGFYNGRKRG